MCAPVSVFSTIYYILIALTTSLRHLLVHVLFHFIMTFVFIVLLFTVCGPACVVVFSYPIRTLAFNSLHPLICNYFCFVFCCSLTATAVCDERISAQPLPGRYGVYLSSKRNQEGHYSWVYWCTWVCWGNESQHHISHLLYLMLKPGDIAEEIYGFYSQWNSRDNRGQQTGVPPPPPPTTHPRRPTTTAMYITWVHPRAPGPLPSPSVWACGLISVTFSATCMTWVQPTSARPTYISAHAPDPPAYFHFRLFWRGSVCPTFSPLLICFIWH